MYDAEGVNPVALVTLSLATAASAGAYLVGLKMRNRTIKYLLKPGTMLLIIALASVGATSGRDWVVVVGLLFSLVGDVFLMLPQDYFVPGLGSFLIAHVLYVGAFGAAGPPLSAGKAVLAAALAAIAFLVYLRLRPGVQRAGGSGLTTAVAVYVAVITLMVWRAFGTGSLLVILGALLFYVSDALLAWNRFAFRFAWAEYGVMATYFAAQYLLALSLSFR